jgi:cell division protein ZipA
MQDNFRNVLIILSAIVITAIFVHGLWTIRKQKNPYKLKTSKKKVEPIKRDFDGKGFDQDGVGQVKIKAKTNEVSEKLNQEDEAIAEHVLSSGGQLPDDLSKSQILIKNDVLGEIVGKKSQVSQQKPDKSEADPMLENTAQEDWSRQEDNTHFTKDELGDDLVSDTKAPEETIKPLYEQPVTQAKPTRAPIKKAAKAASKANLKRNQMEIDFDNFSNDKATANAPLESPKVDKVASQLEPEVIILSVVMPANQQIFGAALLPSLLTLGLKYGDMNIFHRHEDNAGNGKVTFSLANIMNPGSFDLDNIESFATRGVSLFMTLPNAGEPLSVFAQMLNAAKQLAQEFNAQVIDDKRNVMTKQTEQHYIGKIREYDRKSRIAHAE